MRAAQLATPALKLFIYPFVGLVTWKTSLSEQPRFSLCGLSGTGKKVRSIEIPRSYSFT